MVFTSDSRAGTGLARFEDRTVAASVSSAASRSLARRDFAGDGLVHLMLDVLGGDADGVGDGALAGRAVGLHDRAIKAEQRRAAESFGIHAAFDGAKRVLGEQSAELAAGIGGQLAFEH